MTSVLELVHYYSNLLILQYKNLPRAKVMVELFVQEAIMELLAVQIEKGFDLDTAVGAQLDIIGKYVGISRTNQGFSSLITLNDADFLSLIKVGILSSNSGSSLFEIQNLIKKYFSGQVLVFDTKAMQLSYYMDSSIGTPDFAQVVIAEELLPRPMGVGIAGVIYSSDIRRFFGMRDYDLPGVNISPFNSYDDYQMNRPWLSYAFAIYR